MVFPSTSEIYGMCGDEAFNEETSNLVLGPIAKQRWIYSCSKQLLDRVIWAYGQQQGLRFTLFRPFNWMGPNLDHIETAKEGSSRVVTQFLGHLMRGEPLRLVDGGAQRRCITYIRDGVDALMRILRNEGGRADGRIFNIGNPRNDCSIAELADAPGRHPGGLRPLAVRSASTRRDREGLVRGVLRRGLPGHPHARSRHHATRASTWAGSRAIRCATR